MSTLSEQLRKYSTWECGKDLSIHANFTISTGIALFSLTLTAHALGGLPRKTLAWQTPAETLSGQHLG
jgi:IS30 family transposase